jgi:signal transduction histidine kinase/CheY-like chemotaxis protein
MICIVLAFTFLRLPLKAIVLTALPSSIAILLMIFDSLNQRLIASSMVASILVIGISVWLTIYLRERRLFEQTVLIEAAAATERQYADLVRQEKRSLIHDIRQPMSAFAIHMGILRTAQSLTPDLQDKLSTLGFAFDALAGQVDEFARESKGSGNTELMPSALQEVDVIRVVTNVVQLHEPLAASKSTKLTAVYGSGLTGRVVRTNSIQLSNVLQLMVGNAIKFNQGTKVRVSCKVDRGSCSIHITDTGPGIERSNLESIFEAGFSTSPDDTNSQGLGLFNVRRIITGLSDHSVRVRSKPGHYTCFKLTLPLARLMSGPIDGLRMLVVDDEPSITRGLATLFEGAGAVVNTADSATRAMTIVQEDDLAFEMLVCDHDLGSGPNGLDLIQQVREYYDTKVPAILVSGRLAQIGGNTASVEVVSKPFNSETLLQLVERCAD